MNQNEINILLLKQKSFFNSEKTKDISFRIENLRKLYKLIEKNETLIMDALYQDLHKSQTEAYTSEILFVLKEIEFIIKHLKKWNKPQKVRTSLINFPGKNFIQYEPYGITLIIGPWNYPFGLVFSPLAGALAAGNCAIIKPSEISKNTSKVICNLINENFPDEYLFAIEGDATVSQALINEHTDYIFFTGSTNVGKKIMKSAADHLIPVTLELGGKNPCIVDSDINLDVTARRIIWGKFFNAGQTCIAPDYLLVHREIKDKFLEKLKSTLEEFYPKILEDNQDYTHIINQEHFIRLSSLLNEGKIVAGGEKNQLKLFISPTIITDIDYNSKIMDEEIFGPILPVLTYDNLENEIYRLKSMSKPLSLYFFSNDKNKQERIIVGTSSGSVCINGTIHTIMNNRLPFGGVGLSGMGNYHGRASFETFSHKKSVLKKSFWLDLKAMYPPYKTKLDILKKIVKWLY
jgi:acyl-CoA reductase-like NAD-dependent aldehyde dehydrogenase